MFDLLSPLQGAIKGLVTLQTSFAMFCHICVHILMYEKENFDVFSAFLKWFSWKRGLWADP